MSKTEIGYFQVPNFVFNLGLSHYAILVLMNLIRRADRKQSGMCYPSLKTIAEDCSVKSENTIRKAIKELEEQKLVTTQYRGRKLFFFISQRIYDSIDEAKEIYNKYGTLKGHSASDEGIDEIDSTEDIQNYEIQSLDEGVPSVKAPGFRMMKSTPSRAACCTRSISSCSALLW